jgi:hypothetical protein
MTWGGNGRQLNDAYFAISSLYFICSIIMTLALGAFNTSFKVSELLHDFIVSISMANVGLSKVSYCDITPRFDIHFSTSSSSHTYSCMESHRIPGRLYRNRGLLLYVAFQSV